MVRILLPLLLAIGPITAGAAEIVLRADAVLSGSIVRLGDVAEIRGAGDGEAALVAELAAVPLLPAPAPGTQLFLSAAQLRDLLAANAVDVRSLPIRGAATVAIVSPKLSEPTTTKPATTDVKVVQPKMLALRPEREEVEAQVSAAIVRYLTEQTGHDLWDVTVAVEPKLVDMCASAGPQVTISGGRAPWTGRQHFNVVGVEGEAPVKTFVTVVRLEMVVTAVRPIAAGDFVRATDVALRPCVGHLSELMARSLDQVIGKEAEHAIRADTVVLTSHIRAPLLVRRGERVAVRARAGSVTVRTYGTVQQDGSLGDLVQVQSLEGRERYAARVAGVRELEVYAAGASVEEVAAAAR